MREPYERRRLARPELDDVLLVNAAGELTEATRANLAVCLAGRWYTPAGHGRLPARRRTGSAAGPPAGCSSAR